MYFQLSTSNVLPGLLISFISFSNSMENAGDDEAQEEEVPVTAFSFVHFIFTFTCDSPLIHLKSDLPLFALTSISWILLIFSNSYYNMNFALKKQN